MWESVQELCPSEPAEPEEAASCFQKAPESTAVLRVAPRGGGLLAVQRTVILVGDRIVACVTTWAPETD